MSITRQAFAALVGMVLCLLASAAFLPAQLDVAAAPNGEFDEFANFFKTGNGKGYLCDESAGVKRFQDVDGRANAEITDGKTADFYISLRIISCMASPNAGDGPGAREGAIIHFAKIFIQNISTKFNELLLACAVLALVIFGVRVALGMVQEFNSGMIVIGLKLGLVLLGIGMLPELYMDSIATINEFTAGIAKGISTDLCPWYDTHFNDLAATGGGATYGYGFLVPWAKIDCAIEAILKVGSNSAASPVGLMTVAFLSGYLGKGVTLAMASASYSLFAAAEVAVNIYLLSHMALAFMFSIAPLAWICVMFRPTQKYFKKWITLTVSFILQPVLLALFLLMFVGMFENIVCEQSYSLTAAFNKLKSANGIGAPAGTKPTTPGYGKQYCSPLQIQASMTGLIDTQNPFTFLKAANIDHAMPDDQAVKEFTDGVHSFDNIIKYGGEKAAEMLKEQGFNLGGIDVAQLKAAIVDKLAPIFLASFSCYVILFILYAFLQQLPQFVNKISIAAVGAGGLSQVDRIGAQAGKKGIAGLSSAMGAFSSGMSGDFGSMKQGIASIQQSIRSSAGTKRGGS